MAAPYLISTPIMKPELRRELEKSLGMSLEELEKQSGAESHDSPEPTELHDSTNLPVSPSSIKPEKEDPDKPKVVIETPGLALIDLMNLPQDFSDLCNPQKTATLYHLGDFLEQMIQSGRSVDEQEKLALQKIRTSLSKLEKVCRMGEREDWVEYIQNLDADLFKILGKERPAEVAEKKPAEVATETRGWIQRTFDRLKGKK